MNNSYDDIIHLPRPVSKTRPRLPLINRAAQFSPFAALAGHEDAIAETARVTDERIERDEDAKVALSEKLRIIGARIKEQPEVSITYFQPDGVKTGGRYVTAVGRVKKIREYERLIVLTDGTSIPMDEIISIESAMLRTD